MEREKFDDIIRDKIDTHDQNLTRSYNREKSWNAISKKRSNKIWYQISAAIAIAALGFVLALRTEHLPIVNKMSKIKTQNGMDSPQKPIQPLKEPITSTPVLAEKRHNSEKNFTVKEFSSPAENIKLDTISASLSHANINLKTPVANPADTSDESTDIKITFKRGVQIGDQDIKISLSRGQKMKFDFFKKQRYDSTAYVLIQTSKPKQSIELNF